MTQIVEVVHHQSH